MEASLQTPRADANRRYLDVTTWRAFLLVFGPTAGSLVIVAIFHLPWIGMLVFPFLVAAILIVRFPVVGLYSLLAATLLIPQQPINAPDALTDTIPFFINLNESTGISGIGITPAEILMLLILLGILGSRASMRQKLNGRRLMIAYLVFGLTIAIGEVNGLVHGGDFKLSLWELRPQVYGLALFVIATMLIRDPTQLKVLLGITIVAELVRSGEALFRYYVTLSHSLGNLETVLAHEDSYLLSLFLLASVVGLIWFRTSIVYFLVALSPIVFTAIVINHRRAGLLILGLEVLIIVVLTLIFRPEWRRGLGVAAAIGVVVGVAFIVVFWNQQYGSIAEVIRPVKSLFDPSARDLSSDQYRVAEAANLRATFRTSPLFGIGFGHPYYVFYPQVGVSQLDPLWNIIPHNTVLWIPMRLGVIGLVAFWGLISMVIVEAIWAIRNLRDDLVRTAVLFALAAIAGELFNGYVDVGLENYRNMIVLGILIAIINVAPVLARATDRAGLVGSAPPS